MRIIKSRVSATNLFQNNYKVADKMKGIYINILYLNYY